MKSIGDMDDILHRMRVKLHRSNLKGAEGAYMARTDSYAVLSVEDVCAALKKRGGFTGNYGDLVLHVTQFLYEVAYQLCDGFTVNTGLFSVHPVVGGYFDTAHGDREPKKHPVTFRFHSREPLRRLAEHIIVEVEEADGGFIESFLDNESGSVNSTATPGGHFVLGGNKIKVTGDNPDVGVYFVSKADPSVCLKAAPFLPVNTSRKLVGMVPPLPAGEYGIVVKTQYTVGGINLQKPRTITSDFTIRV